MTTVHVRPDPEGLAFELSMPLYGEPYDRWRGALDGAVVGLQKAFSPVARGLTIAKRLKAAGFKLALSPEVREAFAALILREEEDKKLAEERLSLLKQNLAELGMSLFSYQEDGVRWLSGRRSGLLADDMGLGKSAQMLTAIAYRSPTLVVAPSVAKGVWFRETGKWRPDLSPTILSGGGSFRWPLPGEIVAINYELLPDVLPEGAPEGLTCVFDEAQRLKSFGSKRHKRAKKITDVAFERDGRAFALTGTPLENEPPELYAVLDVVGLAVEAFGRWSDFQKLFHAKKVKMGKMGLTKTVWGKPDETVPKRLARVMLRRLKKDVLPQLPDKIISVVEVEIDTDYLREVDKIGFVLRREGVEITDPVAIWEATRESKVVFDAVSSLRKLVAVAKIPAAMELAEDYESAGEPLVVMSAHVEPLKAFKRRAGWDVIDGSTPTVRRTELEEAFQRGELKGLACSIKAAGFAITLTRARSMVFVDESWNPAENAQAEDRLHRLSQTRGVEIIRLFANHELDRHVLRVLHRKEVMIARVVDAAARVDRSKFAEEEASGTRAVLEDAPAAGLGASCPDCHEDCVGWVVDGNRCGRSE